MYVFLERSVRIGRRERRRSRPQASVDKDLVPLIVHPSVSEIAGHPGIRIRVVIGEDSGLERAVLVKGLIEVHRLLHAEAVGAADVHRRETERGTLVQDHLDKLEQLFPAEHVPTHPGVGDGLDVLHEDSAGFAPFIEENAFVGRLFLQRTEGKNATKSKRLVIYHRRPFLSQSFIFPVSL